jgi:RHS repeat-associated protein
MVDDMPVRDEKGPVNMARHAGTGGGMGIVKFGIRWYDPTTGRWTQQDTLDAPLDPANANRYAYAGDDPVNLIDLTGLVVGAECLTEAIGGVLGAIAGITAVALEIGVGVLGAPETAGASLIADAALTTAEAGEIAATVGLAGRGIAVCTSPTLSGW